MAGAGAVLFALHPAPLPPVPVGPNEVAVIAPPQQVALGLGANGAHAVSPAGEGGATGVCLQRK